MADTGNEQDPPPPGKKLFFVGMLVALGLLIYLMTREIETLPPTHPPQHAALQYAPQDHPPASHARQITLGFPVAGRIEQMFFAEQASVKKGDVLASLDKKSFEEALANAKAQLQLAQADYNNSIHIPTSNFNAIEAARADVETAQHAYDEAHAELEKRRSILVAGELDNVYTDDVQDERDTKLDLQRARRKLAQEEDAAGNMRSRDEYKAAVQAAQANVNSAESDLAATQLIAPAAGIVISRSAEPGATVQANAPVYVLSVP
jgi:HlyD family secretion protein